jgi:hypothetical protein
LMVDLVSYMIEGGLRTDSMVSRTFFALFFG